MEDGVVSACGLIKAVKGYLTGVAYLLRFKSAILRQAEQALHNGIGESRSVP